MYKIRVNGSGEHEIVLSGNGFTIDGEHGQWDLISTGKNQYHIIRNNLSYTCEVISADYGKKTFVIRVNGTMINVEVKDRFDELLLKMGMDNPVSSRINSIKAPMPGLVVKVPVEEGQEVSDGDSILILEAMKMENVLKSPGAGVVKTVKVKPSDRVEKNQVLVEFK
jgi:acetyl/propionyl-CoA carboxylase alpha subunit